MTEPRPLDGITVVELGTSVAGPYAGKVLAELGAQVIKVENPAGGDTSRGWGPPAVGGSSMVFEAFNKGKRSITVDMRAPAELERLRKLIAEQADVLFQNLRPGAVERYEIGPQAMLARNPRLIYCNLGAYGTAGPMRDLPGYDPLMQAFTGIASVTGEADRPPVRVGAPVVDLGAGMWAVIGILAVLQRRHETGRGGLVDTSLFEAALAWMTLQIALYQGSGELPKRRGLAGPLVVPNGGYQASDGILVITAGTDRQFRDFSAALGHADWADDPRYASTAGRLRHAEALNQEIAATLAANTRQHWAERLDRAAVPNAPLQTIDEVLAHPQTAASGMLQPSPDGALAVVGLPLTFDGARPPFTTRAPALGADNQLVFDF